MDIKLPMVRLFVDDLEELVALLEDRLDVQVRVSTDDYELDSLSELEGRTAPKSLMIDAKRYAFTIAHFGCVHHSASTDPVVVAAVRELREFLVARRAFIRGAVKTSRRADKTPAWAWIQRNVVTVLVTATVTAVVTAIVTQLLAGD